MLKLTSIKKDYITGNDAVHALKGVSLEFRESEFVSILGQSGCGKTTLLNIIGGLDKYTDGDLEINGKSTKKFTDRDWDTYRNHSIGFIFQSYNLIPHQTVLSNVELALTLSGVSSAERKARAKAALEKVGLGDQINKKPNQMSGGQMQRVAIARALVNDPEILLADEPTGALDSETSVQIMELIKEISKDRLVIMVTHNPELAEQYSTRIINLLDGLVVSDSNPYDSTTEIIEKAEESVENASILEETEAVDVKPEKSATPPTKKATNKGKKKQTSMSFFTAFLLSLNNLLTKKGRTILTSFAGSIGIIGIALIFAVSNGLNGYINHVQETTLSSYPLTIESHSVDISSLMMTLLKGGEGTSDEEKENRDPESVYKDPLIAELVEELSKIEINQNDLKSFKEYLDAGLADKDSDIYKAVSEVQYKYDLNLNVYTKNEDGDIIKSDTNELLTEMMIAYFIEAGIMSESETSSLFGTDSSSSMSMSSMFTMGSANMWQELLADSKNGKTVSEVVTSQYDMIYGDWPNSYDEIVLVVDEDNEIDDLTLYALGLMSKADIDKIIQHAAHKEPLVEDTIPSWTFKEICKQSYKVLLPSDYYVTYDGKTVIDKSNDPVHLETAYENALELKITGIIRLKDTVDTGFMSGAIGYTSKLTEYVIKKASESKVAGIQKDNETYDVISRLPFESSQTDLTAEEKAQIFMEYVNGLSTSEKAALYVKIAYEQAYSKPFDNPMTPEIETATMLDTYVGMALANMSDKQSAIDFITNAFLSGYDEAGMEAIIAASKAAYEQANPGKSFNDLTDEEKQAEYKKQIIDQYNFDDYSYETIMKLITPYVIDGVKMQINAQVDASLAMMLPTNEAKAGALMMLIADENADFDFYYNNFMKFSESTYEENLVLLGLIDMAVPSSINVYTSTFENKDNFKKIIANYNEMVGKDSGKQIEYSDIIGDLMSGITTIINAITYVLVAFVATSLIVSSIMIGVITLISVQERTKEIGVLRAMGASKRDISRVFNAETLIVGLISGLLGILVTLILVIIINIILFALTGILGLQATLGFLPAVGLIVISMVLTLIAGLIPSRVAAKKDPVIALRTE